jgi:light-regulated signal transduction histidine kinase (bacteriophytochrome)
MRMRNATRRMQQLIEDLLSLSRVTHSELTPVQTDLSAIARSIAAQLQAEAPERNAEFRIERDVAGLGDPNLLRIALNNLLGNAWKFSANRERALIEFGALLERVKTVYYVRDNGVGFDMKYAGKLFGAFQRAHSARDFEGTGIGLATVSRIIDRHGGSVWAEAEVDKGATIYFTLAGTGEHQC